MDGLGPGGPFQPEARPAVKFAEQGESVKVAIGSRRLEGLTLIGLLSSRS